MSKVEKYIKIENLSVSDELFRFVNEELLPGTKIIKKDFWEKFNKPRGSFEYLQYIFKGDLNITIIKFKIDLKK